MQNNIFTKQELYFFIFSIGIIFCLYEWLTFFGIEYEDTGFHLFLSDILWTKKIRYISLYPGSLLLEGFWNSLSPIENLLFWNYQGGILLRAINIGFITLILFELFDINRFYILSSSIIGSIIVPFFEFDYIINYFNLPALFFVILLYVYIKYLKCLKNVDWNATYSLNLKVYFGLLVLISIFLVFSRITTIISLLIIPMGIIVFAIYNKKHNKFYKKYVTFVIKYIIYVGVGVIIIYSLFLYFYKPFNTSVRETNYKESILYFLYWATISLCSSVKYFEHSIFVVILFFIGTKLHLSPKKIIVLSIVEILVIFTFWIMLYFYNHSIFSHRYGIVLRHLNSFLILLPIIVFFINNGNFINEKILKCSPHTFRIWCFCFFVGAVTLPLGTNTGSLKIFYSMPLCFSILTILVLNTNDNNKINPATYFLIIFLVSLGILSISTISYREEIKWNLNTSVKNVPTLKFIKTTSQNAQDVENVYRNINQYFNLPYKNDLLVTSHSFLWNYILHAKTYSTWDHSNKYINELKVRLPDYILIHPLALKNDTDAIKLIKYLKDNVLVNNYNLLYSYKEYEFYQNKKIERK